MNVFRNPDSLGRGCALNHLNPHPDKIRTHIRKEHRTYVRAQNESERHNQHAKKHGNRRVPDLETPGQERLIDVINDVKQASRNLSLKNSNR